MYTLGPNYVHWKSNSESYNWAYIVSANTRKYQYSFLVSENEKWYWSTHLEGTDIYSQFSFFVSPLRKKNLQRIPLISNLCSRAQ